MPITNQGTDWRKQAKQAGWKQVRAALDEFEGTVESAEFGQWSAGKEFLEISSVDNIPTKVSEDLDMDISDKFSFRINCSDGASSFWVAEFLEAATTLGLIIPDDLKNKRIKWLKVKKTYNIGGEVVEAMNFIPKEVLGSEAIANATANTVVAQGPVATASEDSLDGNAVINEMLELALGKTEKQFRTAVSLNPKFAGSPLLVLAKMGAITTGLINDHKLVLDGEIYRKGQV